MRAASHVLLCNMSFLEKLFPSYSTVHLHYVIDGRNWNSNSDYTRSIS
uniref:Uncharacterized protein n=1 Tax=Arundo donax TaxID=35708 RepID=A0A0A8YW08_ARUDO